MKQNIYVTIFLCKWLTWNGEKQEVYMVDMFE